MKVKEYRVIGSDPGSKNYGFTCLTASKKRKLKTDIQEIGMFKGVINNLTNKPQKPPKSRRKKEGMWDPLQIQLPRFEKFWVEVIEEFKPHAFLVERYQARGFKGSTGEHISIMNGVIASICFKYGIDFQMITAATWKNRVNKFITLDELYPKIDLTDHSVDSSFIALYGAVQHFNIDWSEVSFNAHVKELRAFEQ